MMKIPNFLLPHICTISTYLGDSAYGAKFAAPIANVRARFEPSKKVVMDNAGNQVVTSAVAFFKPEMETALKPESEVHYNGVKYRVISCDPLTGLSYNSHVEVYLK